MKKVLVALLVAVLLTAIAPAAFAQAPGVQKFDAQCAGNARGNLKQQATCTVWSGSTGKVIGHFVLGRQKSVWYEEGILHTTRYYKVVHLDARQWVRSPSK